MKKILLIIWTVIMCVCIHSAPVFADQDETISSYKTTIEKLNERWNQLWDSLKNLLSDVDLQSYFKEQLSAEDLQIIESHVHTFLEKQSELDTQLQQASESPLDAKTIITHILDAKKILFQSFVPYIRDSKMDSYLAYIKKDVEIVSQSYMVKYQVTQNQSKLKQHIGNLEGKIQNNAYEVSARLQVVLENQSLRLIQKLQNNQSFIALNNEQKNHIIDLLIEKINEKINIIKSANNSTLVYKSKITLYSIFIEKLIILKQEYSEEYIDDVKN